MSAGAGLEKVTGEGFVGPEGDAGIREVDEDGVKAAQVGLFGVLVGGFGAVDEDDREMGGGVGLGSEVLGVLAGEEAVLGGEDGCEG